MSGDEKDGELTVRDLSFLFPGEIVARLESMAEACGLDLEAAPGQPVPPERARDAFEHLLSRVFLTPRVQPLDILCAALPKEYREHLVHLLRTARERARALAESQPLTMFGFPGGPRGMVSTLLQASWVDLREPGRAPAGRPRE